MPDELSSNFAYSPDQLIEELVPSTEINKDDLWNKFYINKVKQHCINLDGRLEAHRQEARKFANHTPLRVNLDRWGIFPIKQTPGMSDQEVETYAQQFVAYSQLKNNTDLRRETDWNHRGGGTNTLANPVFNEAPPQIPSGFHHSCLKEAILMLQMARANLLEHSTIYDRLKPDQYRLFLKHIAERQIADAESEQTSSSLADTDSTTIIEDRLFRIDEATKFLNKLNQPVRPSTIESNG